MPDQHLLEARPAKEPNPPTEQKPEQKEESPKLEPAAEKPPLHRRIRYAFARHPASFLIGAVAVVLAAIGTFFLLRYFQSYESTDDAFVDGHLNPIGARISGTAVAVYVEDNQYVQAGQVLVDLDPRDFQTALAQAKASYSQALSQVQAENPNVPIVQTTNFATISTSQADVLAAQAGVAAAEHDYQAKIADIRQVEAQNVKAQNDVKRYQMLVTKDEISRQQFDTAESAAASQAATVEAARQAAEAALKALDQRRAQLRQAETRVAEATENAPRQVAIRQASLTTRVASLQAAKAQVDQAELNISYTKVVAPVSGVVSTRNIEVGQHVLAGEALLSISQIDDIWVTANFKETQLARMHPGQNVKIHVDAFNQTLDGYVETLAGASGARTSLLPPENATGNYVKVVQRLPVRIRMKQGQDPEHRLRLGMSVEPKVWL